MKGTGAVPAVKDAGDDAAGSQALTTRAAEPGRRSDGFHSSIEAPARLCRDFVGIGVKADLPSGSSADASPRADAAEPLCGACFQPCLPWAAPAPARSPRGRVAFA